MKSVPKLHWFSNEELLRKVECVAALTPLEQELACRLRLMLETIEEEQEALGGDLRKYASTANDYAQSAGGLV